MAALLARAIPPPSCVTSDSHGNVINVSEGTITWTGHPPAVALAGFILVAAFWVATLACVIWGNTHAPPRANSHDLRRSKWRAFAEFWFILYLTADATLRFMQYHGYTFPVEVMLTDLARVKPQGLAEYFFFVAILRCEDVFVVGGFSNPARWRYLRLSFLFLLTLVDLIGAGADYYYRIALVMKVINIVGKDVSADDCLSYSVYAQLKTYADILFYGFSLVCCVFFTSIVTKFRTTGPYSNISKYKTSYTVVVAAFWVHCIQCMADTLVFDQFNINSTQATELINVIIYDATILVLLFFMTKLKKLEIDPKQPGYVHPTEFTYNRNAQENISSQRSPLSNSSTMPSMASPPTARADFHSTKLPVSTTTAYAPVNHF